MEFGDLVEVDLSRSHGVSAERLYVVGAMAYSADVLLVASDAAVWMSVNKGHCKLISSGHEAKCERYRKRYVDRYPYALRPLEKK